MHILLVIGVWFAGLNGLIAWGFAIYWRIRLRVVAAEYRTLLTHLQRLYSGVSLGGTLDEEGNFHPLSFTRTNPAEKRTWIQSSRKPTR